MCTAVAPGSGFKARQGLPRIVFAAQHFFPLIGGAEHTAAILLHALAKRGYAVEAICQGTGHVIHHKGIPVHRVSGPDSMRRAIVSAKPDALLTQLHHAPFVIRTARRLRIPVMLIIPSHEPVCPAPIALTGCDRTCSSCPYWMEQEESMRAQRKALESADVLCCCSGYMAGIIKEFCARESFVLYPPVDRSPYYCSEPDPAGRRYITMCTAMRFKGVETFASIAGGMPKDMFLVAGRGTPEAFELHDIKNITYWPDTAPGRIYAATKLMLVPSIGPEAFGRTAAEAMANGIPVVASRIGGLPEAVGSAGILVDDFKNPKAWIERVQEILADTALYQTYVERGFTHCKRFAADTVLEQFETLLCGLLKTAPPSCTGPALDIGASAEMKNTQQGGTIRILWEGDQCDYHSFAFVNREICLRLIDRGCDICLLAREEGPISLKKTPAFRLLAPRLTAGRNEPADIHVRHQWPPDFSPPASGRWVMIQPWEFGSLPEPWVEPIARMVDEVWVPSTFVRDTYLQAGISEELVQVIPWGVDTRYFAPDAVPIGLETEKRYKFLFVGGTIYRKGIDVLLEAYAEAFTDADDVCLVIKDVGFYREQSAAETIQSAARRKGAPEILYIGDDLPPEKLPGLYAACSCLVHPYRGEGFGLPVAEAMSCALPVIVTGSGACLDFCNAETARLIHSRIRYRNEKRIGGLKTVGNPFCAEPDIASLAEHMRSVYNEPDAGRALGQRARAHIQKNFTWDRTVQKITERFTALRAGTIRRYHASATCSCGNERAEAGRLLAQGKEARTRGEVQTAYSIFTQLTERHPQFDEGFAALGSLLHETGRNERAAKALERAAELAPKSLSAHLQLGSALMKSHDYMGAERAFKKASEIDSSALQPVVSLINVYKLQNRLSDARNLVGTLISDRNAHAPVLAVLGSISMTLQYAEGIRAVIQRLEKISPDNRALTLLRKSLAEIERSEHS